MVGTKPLWLGHFDLETSVRRLYRGNRKPEVQWTVHGSRKLSLETLLCRTFIMELLAKSLTQNLCRYGWDNLRV